MQVTSIRGSNAAGVHRAILAASAAQLQDYVQPCTTYQRDRPPEKHAIAGPFGVILCAYEATALG